MNTESRRLKTGTLTFQLSENHKLAGPLFGFAARNNPKRGFLFVSTVLGKHIPSRPADMTAVQQQLAQQLVAAAQPCDVFIGMAETATGLGQGVYEQYLTRHDPAAPRPFYSHTTRYRVNGLQPLPFEESHSHATALHLYVPEQAALKQRLQTACRVVLVDDEISTGRTFLNLIQALRRYNPALQGITIVSILNWVAPEQQAWLQAQAGVPVSFLSLVQGTFTFRPDPRFEFEPHSSAESNDDCKRSRLALKLGRTGITGPLTPDFTAVDAAISHWPKHTRILLLGTGEFMHPAYALGCHLNTRGFDSVWVQSTTRSPILLGDAIKTRQTLTDSYGDRIPNYLYNVTADQYERILICHETPRDTHLDALSEYLNAWTLQFKDDGTILIS